LNGQQNAEWDEDAAVWDTPSKDNTKDEGVMIKMMQLGTGLAQTTLQTKV
jgi:hypothetical protein